MDDLINRQAVLKKMCEMCYYHTSQDFVCSKCNVYELLAEQPAVEAEPVRQGRWILNSDENFVCSQCRHPQQIGAKDFCGKCGARMDGGVDNDT